MIEIMIFIWVIGFLISMGAAFDIDWSIGGFIADVLTLSVLWPLYLGSLIGGDN